MILTHTPIVIGHGTIGRCLANKLRADGLSPSIVTRDRFIGKDWMETKQPLDTALKAHRRDESVIAYLCIPTHDTGETARDIIQKCAKEMVPVVTCEKGSLAYYAKELMPYTGNMLGFLATVGGGTHMLSKLAGMHVDSYSGPLDLALVINGTLNYVFHEVASSGETLASACEKARKNGYTEPGARDPLSIINAELHDVVRKTCVLHNTVLAPRVAEYLSPEEVELATLSVSQARSLAMHAAGYRLIVRVRKNHEEDDAREVFAGVGFHVQKGAWNISCAFERIDHEPAHYTWLPKKEDNACKMQFGEDLTRDDGKYTFDGPGAGAGPTTLAMLSDAQTILKRR